MEALDNRLPDLNVEQEEMKQSELKVNKDTQTNNDENIALVNLVNK
jgi:hypothetical protein